MTDPSPSKRKRGAQPGNRNALKHGLYSTPFRRDESARLESAHADFLDAEQDLLRVILLRASASLKENAHMSADQHLQALRLITLAIGRLQSLYRLRRSASLDSPAFVSILDTLKRP